MRIRRRGSTRCCILIAAVAAGIGMGAAPRLAGAQRPDTIRRVVPPIPAVVQDSLQAPIGPRRAFIYSFLVPGSAQSILGRHKAASALLLVEAISLTMIRESAADVHEARRAAMDSMVTSYVDAAGNPLVTKVAPRFGSADIKTREAHVEDWVALLVANHLFAGADAFVAAHLWDVPARLGLRVAPHGAGVVGSFKW
jgi:hypothetical protein